MGMTEDNGGHPRKLAQQFPGRTGEGSPSVDETYPVPAGFDDLLEGQEPSQFRGVHVARNCFHRGDFSQLVQGSAADEITGMEYKVNTFEGVKDLPGQSCSRRGQMGIRNDSQQQGRDVVRGQLTA